jgi:DNA-binding NarL/FixJ family response regulator
VLKSSQPTSAARTKKEIRSVSTSGCASKSRVILIAQNRLVRDALARMLARRQDIAVVLSTPLTENLANQIALLTADVLILDRDSFEDLGWAALAHVSKQVPALRTVLFGMDLCEEVFIRAIGLGVVGYLLKDDGAMDLLNAIRAVINQEASCPRILVRAFFDHVARQAQRDSPPLARGEVLTLTRRQHQLLQLIGNGLTNKEIASALNLSEQTVKNHVHRMLRKTVSDNRLKLLERMGVPLCMEAVGDA